MASRSYRAPWADGGPELPAPVRPGWDWARAGVGATVAEITANLAALNRPNLRVAGADDPVYVRALDEGSVLITPPWEEDGRTAAEVVLRHRRKA